MKRNLTRTLLVFLWLFSSVPSLFPAVSDFSDDFNRSLLGPNWTAASGSFAISNNTLVEVCCVAAGKLVLNVPLSGNDYDIQASTYFVDGGSTAARGLLARYQDLNNYYYAKVERFGQARILKRQNGVTTTLVSGSAGWPNQNGWNTIRFRAEGSVLKLYFNGALIFDIQDSSNPLVDGKTGLALDLYYERMDDFSVTVLNATPPVAPPTVDPVPEITTSTQLPISGTKEADTSIWANGAEIVPLDSSTVWSGIVMLSGEGTNQISVLAKNSSGAQSTAVSVSTIMDLNPPNFQILNPLDQANVSSQGFRFEGTASDEGAGVQQILVTVRDYGRRTGCLGSPKYTVANTPAVYDEVQGTWYFDVLPEHVSPGYDADLSVYVIDRAQRWSYQTIRVHVTVPQSLTGTILIASGASETNSQTIALSLTASGNVTRMSFSNDGVNFTTPEPFAAQKSWTLTEGNGPKTVYVKFSDDEGNESQIYSDDINLQINTVIATYVYDDLNRLTRVEYSNGRYLEYDYDEVGNRTAFRSGDV